MRKLADRQGVALILTISILTAICILGLSFMLLLRRDQKQSDFYADVTSSAGVMEAACNYGIQEIKRMSDLYSNASSGGLSTYFGSTIESADSLYSLYFKNAIWATNAKLNLYQCGPEMNATFRQLLKNFEPQIEVSVKDDINKLITQIMAYYGGWKLNELQEVARVFDNSSTPHGARVFNQIQLYTTVYPNRFSDLKMNVIDYGHVDSFDKANKTITVNTRNFQPLTGLGYDPLQGAYIEIIAGPGFDPDAPNINRVQSVSSDHVLLLKDAWPIGKEPTGKSTYKLYSYTVPINFNAADKTLLQSLFEVMGKYSSITGLNDKTIETIMKAVALYRQESSYTKTFENLNSFFNDFLSSKVSNPDFVKRLMDLEEPKGFWDGTNWVIYPLPVPLCFTHNGYFDMDIQAGFKRNSQSANAIPRNLQKRKTTVKVFGSFEQTSREDFEGDKSYQNWMCSSDWVPVRNMADYEGWEYAKNATFQACLYSSETFNVIPDAIKTGLWLDFGAAQKIPASDEEARGLDRLHLFGTYINARNLYSSDLFVINSNKGKVVQNLDSGYLELRGKSPEPAVDVTLGTASMDFDFGEMSIMTRIKDQYPLENPFSHDALTYLPASHTWADHTKVDGTVVDYPPLRWFTPTVVIRRNTSNHDKDLCFRAERDYSYDTDCLTCKIGGTGAGDYTSGHAFKITQGDDDKNFPTDYFYYKPSTYNYIDDYTLNVNVLNSKYCSWNMNAIAGISKVYTAAFPKMNSNPLDNLNDHGNIAFKRVYKKDFVIGNTNQERPFSVYFLRINPGPRSISGVTTNPYYTSPDISLPKAKALKQIKVSYKLGLRKDTSSTANAFITSKDSLKINFYLSLDLGYAGNNSTFDLNESGFPKSVSKSVDVYDDTQGTAVFDVSTVSWPTTVTDRKLGYRLTIENGGEGFEDKRLAYLNTTIAITKVELYYDSETETFSSSDPSF